MLTLRPGSLAYRLIEMLSVTGEYPIRSLHLLGNPRVMRDLVRRLSEPQLVRLPGADSVQTKLVQINGKGSAKSVRLYRGALPILEWIHPGAYRYYMSSFWNHRFPGDAAHRDRNHRVAEAAALCALAEIETVPYRLPLLQMDSIQHTVSDQPSLYLARDLKKIHAAEQNKTMFTRTVGALFYPSGCYAIYNMRSAAMKWSGMGEFKSRLSLSEIARLNAGIESIDSAILLGESEETAMDTLLESERSHRPEFRFDSIYRHVFFVPLNRFGAKLLRLLTVPNWNDRLMDLLFDPEVRSYGGGSMEYDAYIDGKFVLSHLDGDLARLIRFREALRIQSGIFEVLCFPEQMQLLREYLPPEVSVKVISMEAVVAQFYIEEGCL